MCKQFVENVGMHETARRLYEAALVLSKGAATKPGEVAAFFGVSQQRLNNWESRGVSQQGMVSVCQQHPIQMPWLATGEGEMILSITTSNVKFSGVDPLEIGLGDTTPPAHAQAEAGAGSSDATTLAQALQTLAHQLGSADDLSREQAGVLLKRLASEPERAEEIAARLSATLSSGQDAANKSGWSPLPQIPGFLPKK